MTADQLDGLSAQRRLLLERRLAAVRAAKSAAQRIPRADRRGPIPLSHAQQRLWFLDQLTPGLATYKLPYAMRLGAAVDADRLRVAVAGLIARHEVLRTRYVAEDGVAQQLVDPAPATVPLELVDLTHLPVDERDAAMRERVLRQTRTPVDLAAGPMVRAVLIRMAADDHVILLDLHHISTDGWSTPILLRELLAFYQGVELPPLPIQYADYAVWQRATLAGEALDKQLGYWSDRLAGLPTLDFPTDRHRPASRTWTGATLTGSLPAALRQRVEALARRQGCTALTVWLAAFKVLLARYTGAQDIVLGSVFSGRTRPELEPLVGFFANTLVLRTNLGGDPTFIEVVDRVRETLLGAHDHQDVPFDRVVDALRPDRDPGRNPLFQICLVYLDTTAVAAGTAATSGDRVAAPAGDAVAVTSVPTTPGTSRFDFVLYLAPGGDGGIGMRLEHSLELFDSGRMTRLLGHYERLVEALVARPDGRVHRAALLDEAERHALITEWNRTEVNYRTAGLTLPELVSRQAARTPSAVAARCAGGELTYPALDAAANQLAHRLRALGVGPESVVGVLVGRSLALPVTLLAVLKAGGAYLPLDPEHPPARLAHLLTDAGCRLVVTDDEHRHRLPNGVRAVGPDEGEGQPTHPPRREVGPGNLAYVIYTSGSTGGPKGVLITHRSAVNYVTSAGQMFALAPGERVLQFSSPTFDASVLDIFGALGHGATLILAAPPTLRDAAALAQLLRAERVSFALIAPAMLAVLDPADLPDLRAVCAAGEAYPAAVVNRWRAPGRTFHNGYGPTETTVICLDHPCPPGPLDEAPPIGRPLPNQSAYVLDRFGSPVPVGVPGELFVGGAGLARGYLNSPGLTARRFVPDPYGPAGGRLYRTGDLAAWRADGVLRFLGRLDDQVKIRGFRVEPGEVTAALLTHPAVASAIVVAQPDGDGRRLVAYYVPVGPRESTVDELRAHLAGLLPEYLIPASFVALPGLPVTSSGKVDRRALPGPPAARPELAAAFEAPATALECDLARIWAGVLGVDRVGRHDNFFALGGDSIRSIQMVARIQAALAIPVAVATLFRAPTIAGLAAALSDGGAHDGPVVPLRPSGRRSPFFVVHASGGSVLPYAPLVAALDAQIPCYGLESAGLDGRAEPPASIPDLARHYVAAIAEVQPAGPYRLGGWSLGGAIAYEMAGQLQDAGERVEVLMLLDTGVPPRLDRPPPLEHLLRLFVRDLAGLAGVAAPELAVDGLPPAEQIERALAMIEAAALVPAGVREQLRDRLRVFVANTSAGATWQPRRYLGRATLFITGDESVVDARVAGWRDIAALTHRRLPGNHYSMLAPPHVHELARALEKLLG